MPVMFWNDPEGEKYHNAYFARFRQYLVPRRFRRDHRAWRPHHPSAAPMQRSTPAACASAPLKSMRRSNGFPRSSKPWPSARIGTRCARRAVRATARGRDTGRALMARIKQQISERRIAPPCAGENHRRSPIFRAPNPARSSSSRCAMSCMAAPVKNKEALANPEALDLFANLVALKA